MRGKINLTNVLGVVIIVASVLVVLWQYGAFGFLGSDNAQELKIDIDISEIEKKQSGNDTLSRAAPRCCP